MLSSLAEADGCKVFSATKQADREELGERITRWMQENAIKVLHSVITQSSDNSFHCLSITLFYKR